MGRPLDTSGDAFDRQVAALRSMTPTTRLRLADDMSQAIRRATEAGIAAGGRACRRGSGAVLQRHPPGSRVAESSDGGDRSRAVTSADSWPRSSANSTGRSSRHGQRIDRELLPWRAGSDTSDRIAFDPTPDARNRLVVGLARRTSTLFLAPHVRRSTIDPCLNVVADHASLVALLVRRVPFSIEIRPA